MIRTPYLSKKRPKREEISLSKTFDRTVVIVRKLETNDDKGPLGIGFKFAYS